MSQIILPGAGARTDSRHPIWETPAQRVTLVERVDQPGLLAVALRGGRFVCALPAGYDGLTQVHRLDNGQVIAWHPNHAPLVCDFTTGKVTQIDTPPQLHFKNEDR